MAGVCVNWAREPLTKDAHRACLTLARTWLRAATSQAAALSDYLPKSPLVFETPNELPFDRKVLIDDCRAIEDGQPEVGRKPCEFQLHSGGSRDRGWVYTPKLPLRGSLRIAILALTIGATTGAGSVLVWVGQPMQMQQHTPFLASQTPTVTADSANSSAAELPYDRQKVEGQMLERADTLGPVPLVVSASAPMDTPSDRSDTPGHSNHAADRTNTLDITSSLGRSVNKEVENAAPHVERNTHRHARRTVRHLRWRHRYRFAFFRIW